MSTLTEIEAAIAQLPPAQWQEIRRWMDAHAPLVGTTVAVPASAKETPDFLARQKALFGERVLPDSQAVLDDSRADRF
ncbi:MAG: hypothetical protein ABI680_13030 [Chthoniobacteraceae bacterium]